MKRVLALAVACLLVAGALFVRGSGDDGEGDDGNGEGDDGDGSLVVACIPELEDACEALDDVTLRFEDPSETLAALDAGERLDAWVTLDPWPTIAVESLNADLTGDPQPVAQSELILLIRTERVPDGCQDAPTWACAVDTLEDLVALPRADSALRPIVLGHAAADFFGPGLAANDFGDPELSRLMGALDSPSTDPLRDMRVGLPEPAATGAPEALASMLLGRRLADFTVSRGASPATVAVVVAGPEAGRIAGDDRLVEALSALGWEPDPNATTIGLPNPGVLLALSLEVSS